MEANFNDRALAEIDGLHRVLQRWFRAEGTQDPAPMLLHFDPKYTMVAPSGKLLTLDTFRAALPSLWGSRPGLIMEISGETLVHAGPDLAVMTYQERQHLAGTVTDRFSTVLMLNRNGHPVWRHLQETLLA
jgi:hypothetical protein